MTRTAAAGTGLVLMLLSACAKAPEPKELPAPPSIRVFEAEASRIRAGESVELHWSSDGATGLRLLDDTGAEVAYEGDASNGTATVSPGVTRFYVLRVTGPGGQDSAFVQVAVDEDLKEVFLVAVPPVVDSGEAVQLLWSAHDARDARLRSTDGSELVLDPEAGAGIVEIEPERTTGYTLVASGVDPEAPLTTVTEVKVRPVLVSFDATPAAGRSGETITLRWTTKGAAEVVLKEALFGELYTAKVPGQTEVVDAGEFSWTVPDVLPGGGQMLEGQPLQFILEVKTGNPAVTLTRELEGYVGDAPRILEVVAPAAVSGGATLELGWRTVNATRVQVLSNGAVIYEPLPKDQAEVRSGTLKLHAPTADTVYTIKAWSHLGAVAVKTAPVRVVALPSITEFNLPETIDAAGDAALAAWKTTNATRVALRTKNGPVVHLAQSAASVAAGSASLYPAQTTTFVLEAFNDAGDVATAHRTVEVALPMTFTAGPTPAVPDLPLNIDWSIAPGAVAELIGDPSGTPVRANPSTTFVDLKTQMGAKVLYFDDGDEGVRAVRPDFTFRFPFLGRISDTFYVSTNGFVTFVPNTGALPDNQDLSAPVIALPPMIAPFWDDLDLGETGEVRYLLEGTQFPRRLIIQWSGVQTSVDPAASLTFQVQLYESGAFYFAYGNLTGTGANGSSATVGWRRDDVLFEDAISGGPLLASNDEILWFGAGALEGGYQVVSDVSGVFSLFGRRSDGTHLVLASPVNVIPPGAVVVNEAMVWPEATATKGKWIELYNASAAPVDLEGVELRSNATQTGWTIPAGMILPPGAFLLVGESVDPAETGGAPVEFTWGALTPDTSDDLMLMAVDPISQLSYLQAELKEGASVQPPDQAITSNMGKPMTCARTQTYGSKGAIGTPGGMNETCFDYTLERIPVAFRDIAATGTPIFPLSMSSLQWEYKNGVDVSAAPIPYDGRTHTAASVAANGYLSFNPLNNADDNYAIPGASQTPGFVAPFWDMLNKQPGTNGGVFYQRFEAGQDLVTPAPHWIFQWSHLTHYEWGGANDDDLNFQVKFFDDGRVEFHYGEMKNGTGAPFSRGEDATVWLEYLDGSAALRLAMRQPVIDPHTAYRFTPKP